MAEKEYKIRFKNKVDTTENWNVSKLILMEGEIAYEKTATGKLLRKIGDGKSLWSALPYSVAESNDGRGNVTINIGG